MNLRTSTDSNGKLTPHRTVDIQMTFIIYIYVYIIFKYNSLKN